LEHICHEALYVCEHFGGVTFSICRKDIHGASGIVIECNIA
jgi:hypothetical protein